MTVVKKMETLNTRKWTFINVVSVIALSVVINIINTYVGFSIFPIEKPVVTQPISYPTTVVETPDVPQERYGYTEFCLNDGSYNKQFKHLVERGEVTVMMYQSISIGSDDWVVEFDNTGHRYDAPVKVQYKAKDQQLCKAIYEVYSKIVDYKL